MRCMEEMVYRAELSFTEEDSVPAPHEALPVHAAFTGYSRGVLLSRDYGGCEALCFMGTQSYLLMHKTPTQRLEKLMDGWEYLFHQTRKSGPPISQLGPMEAPVIWITQRRRWAHWETTDEVLERVKEERKSLLADYGFQMSSVFLDCQSRFNILMNYAQASLYISHPDWDIALCYHAASPVKRPIE